MLVISNLKQSQSFYFKTKLADFFISFGANCAIDFEMCRIKVRKRKVGVANFRKESAGVLSDKRVGKTTVIFFYELFQVLNKK